MLNEVIKEVTNNIINRSEQSRSAYMDMVLSQEKLGRGRNIMACSNLAHTVAAMADTEKEQILFSQNANIGIITAYNDMLSAHCPYKIYPDAIKQSLKEVNATAQVASGVPAMCDGVTQGQVGMDMSLFSRDVIAQATCVGLSHNVFDGVLLLGICDKIAPGLIMGAACFGNLPTAFVPSGPMSSGISNEEKTKIRQDYAAGLIDKKALQTMECGSYHSAGTCTFYGTANTNQLVFEAMGLMLPGSAFVAPNTTLRQMLTDCIAKRIVDMTIVGKNYRPLYKVLDVKNIVNGMVALLASGGSTNHTLHLVAVARACGYIINWDDFSKLSAVVPLLVNIYPNAAPDINALQDAGGVPSLMKALHDRALLHDDVLTCCGSFKDQLTTPIIEDGKLVFKEAEYSFNEKVLVGKGEPFKQQGGIKVLDGNLGRSVIKISAVAKEHHHIVAKAAVFNSQHDVERAYKAGRFTEDTIIVVRYAGPAAAGMPELHKLMPILGNLQKQGLKVALITDGRLSGASGKIPSAIHMCPEALRNGPIALLQDGDIIDFDAEKGTITCLSSFEGRVAQPIDTESMEQTFGRVLFKHARASVSSAEEGASFLF